MDVEQSALRKHQSSASPAGVVGSVDSGAGRAQHAQSVFGRRHSQCELAYGGGPRTRDSRVVHISGRPIGQSAECAIQGPSVAVGQRSARARPHTARTRRARRRAPLGGTDTASALTMLITLALVIVMVAATWIAGWAGVAVIAVLAGLAYGLTGRRTWGVAVAAVLAWAAVLLADAASGRERGLLVLLPGTM